ncbi:MULTISPECIES: N-acetylmuramoyl-L-alanine amidase [unclassified Streptomyces]|uniref:N-acetylmuramoyl-L-alanine amidase n=1 Tax=unclassified Streptomyces TaxID=2593676 RepID=UPI0004CC3830|nr:N-acetylmuramoyl-L-alanine amidase [Streptomyces sp. NRRL F-5630]
MSPSPAPPPFPSEPSRPPRSRRLLLAAAVAVPVLLLAGGLGYGLAGRGGEDGGGTGGDDAKAAPAPARTGPTPRPSPSAGPLSGKVVVLDPGHNPDNRLHTTEINRQVDVGNGRKECDTTGTETNAGYPEAEFTLDVVRRARKLLRAQGAEVRLTHDGDREFGPCVDERAEIGNEAEADAAVSVHADGAPAGARGFHVIMPAAVHAGKADTRAITAPSHELGTRLATAFAKATDTSPATYINGGTGLDTRSDLGGLNLSRVPKVFLECGNMRDARDAGLMTSAKWRERAARGVAAGVAAYLAREAGEKS